MLRQVITINEDLCDGCEKCVTSCAEGALKLIDGKARLINEIFCDGLGACIGGCPQNAITVVEKETEVYNEALVIRRIIPVGEPTIIAHLKHLYEHGQMSYVKEALEILKQENIHISIEDIKKLEREEERPEKRIAESRQGKFDTMAPKEVRLQQWPIQLHLESPFAEVFQNAKLLLTADCVPLAYPNFHSEFLGNHALAIACPKLDSNKDAYLNKIVTMITESNLQEITVLIIQVPCCSGLYHLAKQAIETSGKSIPLHVKVISIDGKILQEI